LRHGAKACFCSCEGGEACLAAQRARGAGEQNGSLTTWNKAPRDFAADQKAAQGVLAPQLLEAVAGQIEEGIEAVTAGVVKGKRERAVAIGMGDDALCLIFDAGVSEQNLNRAARSANLACRFVELALRATDDNDMQTLAREASRRSPAQAFAGADTNHQRCLSFGH